MMGALSRWGWFCLLAVLVVGSLGSERAVAARRPNVILIMPDQMRGQAMGVAGHEQVRTPNLDALADQGLYLPNTIANGPVCCPARATISTGRYPHAHGLIINDLRLRESEQTLAETLGAAGYATAFVGKWHLDGGHRMPGYIPPGPRRQGFQYWAANECNHSHFDSIYFRNSDKAIPIKKFEVEVWMDETIRFIRENREKPFFVWYACGPPHNPYKAPPRFEKLYDPASLIMRPNWKEKTRFGSREDIARYYAAITAIDEQVGRLMRELDELKLADDTIVLFTSDHGDMLGSHGLPFKCKPYEESIRVPGIVRYPRRIKAGQRSDLLFSHVDFMPTLLSMCGVAIPGTVQGRDLSAHLTGGADASSKEQEAAFLQIYEPRLRNGVPAGWRGVRTKRYTYARLKDKPWLLYDLEKDPYQLKNLASDPGHEQMVKRFDAMIADEMARTGDRWTIDLEEEVIMYKKAAAYDPPETAASKK